MRCITKSYWLKALLLSLGLMSAFNVMSATGDTQPSVKNFVVVNGFEIPQQIFVQAVRSEIRSKYYHGRVSDEDYKQLLDEVSQRLIDNTLLMLEAERLQITPDAKVIDNEILALLTQFKNLPTSKKEQLIQRVRKQFESRERIKILENNVRDQVKVTESMAQQYYDQNSELFVVPLKRKLSLILIKVSPNSLSIKWSEAKALISEIREKVVSGESFAGLAKRFSDDETAALGGDMGFLHEGVLSEKVEAALVPLVKGELSKPIRILEGYVLVRLEGVKSPVLKSFSSQKKRAYRLLSTKLADESWSKFIEGLRQSALIVRSDLQSGMMNR